MTSRLQSVKPFPEQMITCYQTGPQENTSVEFYQTYKNVHSRKYIRKCRLRNVSHAGEGLVKVLIKKSKDRA